MTYRDDFDAARSRAAVLEKKVSELEAASEADAAALSVAHSDLALAKREVDRLRALEPGSASQRAAPYRAVLLVALGLVLATAVAGYSSEQLGIYMSYCAAFALGIGVCGWLGSRVSRVLGLALASVGGLVAVFVLLVFYEAIWPSL